MASGAPVPPARPAPRHDDIVRSEKKIEELRKGRLPQMVDWFDPTVLGMVAVRNMISATIGDYADQRPMQAAAEGTQYPLSPAPPC